MILAINWHYGEHGRARRQREATVKARLDAAAIPYTVEYKSFGSNLLTVNCTTVSANVKRLTFVVKE